MLLAGAHIYILKMPAYIYMIKCCDVSVKDTYIGSTNSMGHRKWSHKYACKNSWRQGCGSKLYVFIRENGGFENWEFIVLHKLKDDQIEKRFILEQECIDFYEPTLNSKSAYKF